MKSKALNQIQNSMNPLLTEAFQNLDESRKREFLKIWNQYPELFLYFQKNLEEKSEALSRQDRIKVQHITQEERKNIETILRQIAEALDTKAAGKLLDTIRNQLKQ